MEIMLKYISHTNMHTYGITYDILHTSAHSSSIKYSMMPKIFNLDENLHTDENLYTQKRYSLLSTGGV